MIYMVRPCFKKREKEREKAKLQNEVEIPTAFRKIVLCTHKCEVLERTL
jgi:hypothetical protein